MGVRALIAALGSAWGRMPKLWTCRSPHVGRYRPVRALLGLTIAAAVLVGTPAPAQGAAAVIEVDRLSGATRYETAAEIAESYAREVEDRGRPPIDTILLTSGADAHFGCALPAPALSRRHEAPLLLTARSQLSSAVKRFVNEYDIDRAYILGGTDVVSKSVSDELKALNNVDVTRVAGGDCYGTAVEVAKLVGESPGIPGSYRREGRTALVATGEVFADALAAGPLAYRGQHPILLTPRSALHQQASEFLVSSGTRHVIVLGGTAAVSTGVERAIEQLGISVDRLFGADRYATAVRVAEELLGVRAPQVCFSGDEVGLAYGFASPDAITSGPLLGERCAPLLLTGSRELPGAASGFLASDTYVTGDADGDLRITILGGTAAVSRVVESKAANAARLAPILANVSALEGACHFTVTFSEPVWASDAQSADNYRRGSQALSPSLARVDAGAGLSTSKATVVLAGASIPAGSDVATGCTDPLDARERVGVVGGAIRGASDRRTVQRAESSVRSDHVPPSLTVSAPDGGIEMYVEISEPVQAGSFDVTFTRDRVDHVETVYIYQSTTRLQISVPLELDELETDDRIEIPAGAVRDLAGNGNRRKLVVVQRDTTQPRVRYAAVTAPAARQASSVELGGRHSQTSVSGLMRIDALDDGAASGAAGNAWQIRIRFDHGLHANDPPLVTVTESNRRVDVSASPGSALPDLVSHLNRDPRFRELFEADLTGHNLADDATVDETPSWVAFSGGVSTADLSVAWTELVRDCEASDLSIRFDRIAVDADGNGLADFRLDGADAAAGGVQFVSAPDGNPYIVAGSAACDGSAGAASGTLVARLSSATLSKLPTPASLLYVSVGAAYDLRGNPSPGQRISMVLQR